MRHHKFHRLLRQLGRPRCLSLSPRHRCDAVNAQYDATQHSCNFILHVPIVTTVYVRRATGWQLNSRKSKTATLRLI
jgi:hypothetical protein